MPMMGGYPSQFYAGSIRFIVFLGFRVPHTQLELMPPPHWTSPKPKSGFLGGTHTRGNLHERH